MTHRTAILICDTSVFATRIERTGSRSVAGEKKRVSVETPLTLGPGDDLDSLVAAITASVEPFNDTDGAVTLIIPVGWCFTHPLQIKGGKFNERGAGFQMEEYLPVALEEVTCAFARATPTTALAFAVPTQPMKRLLGRLAEAGITGDTIGVDILAAAQATSRRCALDAVQNAPCGTMIRDAGRCAVAIQSAPSAMPSFVRTIHSRGKQPNESGDQIAMTEVSSSVQPAFWQVFDARDDADAADILLAISEARMPNLAHGSLAPCGRTEKLHSALTRTAALLALFLVIALTSLEMERSRCTAGLKQGRDQAAELYRSALPGSDVPVNPAMRLASERIRLERLAGPKVTDSAEGRFSPEDRLAVFSILGDFASRLPAEVRINLIEINVDEQQVVLRGQTGDHRHAERIVEAINGIDGLVSKPPRTSRIPEGGVDFSVLAKRVPHTAETIAQGK